MCWPRFGTRADHYKSAWPKTLWLHFSFRSQIKRVNNWIYFTIFGIRHIQAMLRFVSPTAKLNSPRCRITDSVSPRSTSNSLILFNEFNFWSQPTKRFHYHQRETIPTLTEANCITLTDENIPGPLGCVLYCFRCWLIHPPLRTFTFATWQRKICAALTVAEKLG